MHNLIFPGKEYCPRFTDEETEGQSGELAQGHRAGLELRYLTVCQTQDACSHSARTHFGDSEHRAQSSGAEHKGSLPPDPTACRATWFPHSLLLILTLDAAFSEASVEDACESLSSWHTVGLQHIFDDSINYYYSSVSSPGSTFSTVSLQKPAPRCPYTQQIGKTAAVNKQQLLPTPFARLSVDRHEIGPPLWPDGDPQVHALWLNRK